MVIRSGVTIDEFLHMPETKPASELMWGKVVQKPMTKRDHWLVADALLAALRAYRKSRGGLSGPEATVPFRPSANALVPDLAYWAPTKPMGTRDEAMPPTLAVEIRSEGQSVDSLRAKCLFYLANGVDVAWLVDPAGRWIETFEADGARRRHNVGDLITSRHLPDFEMAVSDVFAELDSLS
jgi:Uma2 family endonuclease